MVENPDETAETLQALVLRVIQFLNYIQHPKIKSLSPTRCFVLSRTIIGCLRSSSLERLAPEATDELTEALLDMVLSQLDIHRQTA